MARDFHCDVPDRSLTFRASVSTVIGILILLALIWRDMP